MQNRVRPHGEEQERTVTKAEWHLSDTMVQENNTMFPADAKLCKKVIERCNRIAEKAGIPVRRGCRRENKQLVLDRYNGKHPQRVKKAKKARKRLKTRANALIGEVERKMSEERREQMALYRRVINQQPHDTDKLYSLHKPFRRCISKEQYEFGNKVGIIVMGKKGRKVITAVRAFAGKPYDGHTIEPLPEQMQRSGPALPQAIKGVKIQRRIPETRTAPVTRNKRNGSGSGRRRG